MKRGLIVSSPIKFHDPISFEVQSGGLDLQELRIWLPYFDELIWPDNNFIHFSGGVEEEFLIGCGVLKREQTIFQYGFLGQALLTSYLQVYERCEEKEPGSWALAQGQSSLVLPAEAKLNNRGLTLDFLQSLPIPDVEVPLEEILNFKERRKSELAAFRAKVEEFAVSVASSADFNYAKVAGINKMLSEIGELLDENGIPRRKSLLSLQANLSIDGMKAVTGAVGGALIAGKSGAILGALATMLDIKMGFGLDSSKTPSPYAYLVEFARQVEGRARKHS